mmetsp:Transcript_6057/g.15450  ORF Transcript_6057/g.15450 Transcript_6057/m.15450 type:complete len:422 (-) Transcript_6057:141-1406(-)|eukprot:CAMPEP_0182917106 /NCGR_PEP_ID=MMETSP0105_2-20130417/1330_1 /TAXON_ID=81532 ORGANISM="Acanthoeca-like sp., Strain 10tr" /NCGR_SAMPLE_ID=MMETSP0105_2 /ASSEMBLY_ACC=CAM_ASM_000205 /LENGTH=421 /DNA_ID=CAMNT_0025054095 /DNA_START=60 /DNA_END=1325 /DNA_ORIENTATION=-
MRLVLLAVAVGLAVGCAGATTLASAGSSTLVEYVAAQTNRSNSMHPNRSLYPTVVHTPAQPTDPLGQWQLSKADSWVAGFWPAINWDLGWLTGNATWANVAREYTAGLAVNQHNNRTHDVGFIVYNSFGLGYQAVTDEDTKRVYGAVLFNAAMALAERYNPTVGCTLSWNPDKPCNARSAHYGTQCNFTVIIDNMMNLELLMFAGLKLDADHCGGCTQEDRQRLVDIAEHHANTTAAHHVRSNFSVHHIVCYDPETGAERFACNGGAEIDSTTWARGQAWAIYGFTMMYRYTQSPFYLYIAEHLADFWIDRLATFPDHIPNFDLQYNLGPLSNLTNRDASAAAIAASALAELANHVDTNRKVVYNAYAATAVSALSKSPYKSEWSRQEGAIQHCNAQNTDVAWADHYLLEALRRGVPPPTP